MSKEKQIEEMAEDLRYCHTEFVGDYGDIYTDYNKTAEKLTCMGYRKQSEVIKEFVKRFEGYIGNCTFSMGQANDIQYALKKATEEMEEKVNDYQQKEV